MNLNSPLYKYSHIGFSFAFEILVFVFLGHYIEGKYDFAPFGIITGFFIGFPFAFYHLMVTIKRMGEEIEEEEKRKRQH